MHKLIMLLILLSLPVTQAWSAGQPEVRIQLTALRIVKSEQGKETLASGSSAKPGEIIEYRATYKNSGNAVARKLIATLPVPVEMEYLPGSATPATAGATTDGVAYSKIPLKRKVKLAGGQVVVRDVPFDEYRALRWELEDLPPGTGITVSARMKIKADQQGPVIIQLDSANKYKSKGEK
jgi:uncharacterized repeat protein (TIGR01451 family)